MKPSQVKALDKMFAELIQLRSNGYCAKCGKYFGFEGINPCHFYVRKNFFSVRWDEDNVSDLCTPCHDFFDLHKSQFRKWLKDRLGEDSFEALHQRMLDTTKLDYEDVKALIQNRIKEIQCNR